MEKPRNSDVVNNEDVEALEKFLQAYREGKIRGVVLTYETDEGPEHKLMGQYADDLLAASNQVRRLDLALNRHFLRSQS